jgi:hypothetical protein
VSVHKSEYETAVLIHSKGRVTKSVYRSQAHTELSVPLFFIYDLGDTFDLPDHHGNVRFTLKKISPAAIFLTYRTSFSHMSFGKNLVTIDEGELEIPLRKFSPEEPGPSETKK